MPKDDKQNYETFIDADDGFSNESNSYESIILNQIQACIKILSREMTGGQIMYKESSTGNEKYIEDVRELVINHIDTLRMSMITYIKGKNKESINSILEEVENFKTNIGENKILIPGRGYIKIKDLKSMPVDSPVWKEFIQFKANKYRQMFEILVRAYNEEKQYIRELEQE